MTKQPEGTVLYVDDDESNRNTFALVFREAGFEVKEAATGGEALRLAEEKPDVVVLDVNLPDINGVEVCRHIKMHPATRAIPVMHMSAVYVTSEDKTHALEEGADAYVTKPVEPRELVAQVKALLRIHQAEERATAAAQQWQATFASINDGVCLLDRHGRVLRCNPAAERILQRPAAEILERNCDELIPTPPGSGERSVFRRMLQTRRREVAEVAVGNRWLQTVADPMLREAGGWTGAIFILSDITERKHLQEQLQQSQKMEAVGRLAGGVAHDFNNLLTAVTGNVSLLLAGKAEQDPDREMLLAIDQAAWRAAELTSQLLKFSRRSTPRLLPIDVRICLEEVAALLRRTIDPRITMEVRSAPDLWVIQADSGQINQVLMNLCLNARDAMPEGGHLLLEAENVVVNEEQARQSVQARPGQFARLRVSDSGRGIPPDVLPHVFEPFFTTKGLGEGTGLGLATVFGVVGQHEGWVECSSTVNQGTCFTLYLPRCESAARPIMPAAAPRAPVGTETILLADDDVMVRSVGQEILRRYGYKVLPAEDGERAAAIYSQEQDRIDLVILDLSMPRVSWRDTLRHLLQINPRVRVLLASGHTGQIHEPAAEGVVGFLTKPYRSEDLAAAVRKALDESNGGDASDGGESEPPAPPTAGPGTEPGKAEEDSHSPEEETCSPGEEQRTGLSKAEAEEMLDWLEVNGFQRRGVRYGGKKGFTVRWEATPARRPSRCRRWYRQPCPSCGSTRPPCVVREMATLSWVLVGVGLLVWPLLALGLLLRRDVWRCWDCRRVLGRGRRLTLSW
jgi:PAS domain S-box-containing protein